jgi:paraquat-inducible protein B
MLTTYTLTVPVFGSDGNPVAGARVVATLDRVDYTADGAMLPKSVAAETDEAGICTLALVSNLAGTQDSRYRITIRSAAGSLITTATIQMPEADATLQQLVDALPMSPEYSTAAAISAAIATTKAQQTAADALQTAEDRIATGEDRQQVAQDAQTTLAARDEAVSTVARINILNLLGAI